MNVTKMGLVALAILWAPLLSVAGPGGGSVSGSDPAALAGHGDSTADPLYQLWLPEYNRKNPTKPVYYLQMGTVESLRSIKSGVGDFGGGEMPLTDEQMSGKPKLANLPIAALALVPIYNIPEFSGQLRLTGPVLARICLGTITRWSDPAITALNPGANLPNAKITFIHRAPGTAMNYVLTEYLSKISPEFRAKVGRSHSPGWPAGISANGQFDDMAQGVRSTPNSIGYGALKFAQDAHLKMATMQNAAGEFVAPSPETIAAAVGSLESSIPPDFRMSFTNAPGRNVYPIVSFTWIYVPVDTLSPERASLLADFIEWVVTGGQSYLPQNGFAQLPPSVVTNVKASLVQLRK